MNILDPALREHAERLLVGTDLTVEELLSVTTGALPSSGPVAAAVRDGWTAAEPLTEPVRQP